MILSLAKRYVWILNAILCGLFLHSIMSYITEGERKIQILPPVEKGDYQIPTASSAKFLPSRKAYNVIVEKNMFKRGGKTTQPARDLLSIDFSKADLKLSLLGTVTRKGFGTAIIKNTITGKLKTYAEGDVIDLINTEEVRIIQVSNCIVMIERKGRYETLECNTESLTEIQSYKLPSPLARYKIMNTPEEDKNEFYKSKSKYEEEILRASKEHKIDPYLVKAIIKVESNFNPLAVSSKNAGGIMQLMPETAMDYGVDNPFDPKENIDGGVRFLRDLMNYFNGDLKLALAAYNAGKGAVIKYGFRIPPYIETIDYVEKVLGHYNLLKFDRYEGER